MPVQSAPPAVAHQIQQQPAAVPALDGPSESPSPAAINHPGHGGAPGQEIWILDDDERLCAMLSQRIAAVGWCPSSFIEPRQLDEALDQGDPDLLILDEMLPGRSGCEVMAGLRQRGHRFPVLMLSALRSPADRIAGLEAGADDYLGKPFEFRELQLRIIKLLDLRAGLQGSPSRQTVGFRLGPITFQPALAELQTADGVIHRISRGDASLLQALCLRQGEVVGRQFLARASGSLVDARQSRSIDVRMSRLRRLLESLLPPAENGELIEACRGLGYRLCLPVIPLDQA
jgi:two-component system phosphate regulon response regulator OmpR